jgi:DNA-binding NtrC family response regulator
VFGPEARTKLEATFESGRGPDDWTCQLLEMAAHVAALLIEIERTQGRVTLASRVRSDGAAPLIGSSRAMRVMRQRIERVAATDFTILVEGASSEGKSLNRLRN